MSVSHDMQMPVGMEATSNVNERASCLNPETELALQTSVDHWS